MGINVKFQEKKKVFFLCIFFFLAKSTGSVYWKDSILMLATHTAELDYEERNCLVHQALIIEMNYYG